MRVLLTGGGGFVGQWLARALLRRGDDVVLAGLGSRADAPAILREDEWSALTWWSADLRNQLAVDRLVRECRPDAVVHLAGVSFPPDAEDAPVVTYDINALGVVRLLASVADVRRAGTADPTVLVIGSGLQYGSHQADAMPLTETADQRPLTTYAASKAAQEVAALQQFRASGIRVICTRSFNHSGVGHGSAYLLPSLVRRVQRIARRPPPARLELGNDVVRDYLHVSDVVTAYLALVARGTPGDVYNVCSGIGLRASELAAAALKRAGVRAEICVDASLVRSSDIPVLVGSPEKLARATGWKPTRTSDDILDDLLNAATD